MRRQSPNAFDPGAIARTAAGGALAAMSMTGFRRVTTHLGLVGRLPPEEMAKAIARPAMKKLPPNLQQVAIEALHWGVGITAGALFALLPRSLYQVKGIGALYGLAVLASYEFGIAKLLGIPSHQHTAVERTAIALDHMIYGILIARGRCACVR